MPKLNGGGSYSIPHGLQAYVKFTTLHHITLHCNKYTSNMAAVTVV